MYPATYKYTKTHEWLDAQGSTASVGITDHAQSLLGDIVFVELPAVGQEVKAGETFGTVESVKAVSEMYAPASGTVTEINTALTDAPELINTAANETWLFKMQLANEAELTTLPSLIDSKLYETFVSEETGH